VGRLLRIGLECLVVEHLVFSSSVVQEVVLLLTWLPLEEESLLKKKKKKTSRRTKTKTKKTKENKKEEILIVSFYPKEATLGVVSQIQTSEKKSREQPSLPRENNLQLQYKNDLQ
jgi:hypothetical protein